ncbi:Cytochrome P460 [Bradyrhizobium sp. STM 3843]|uniref:cytochrome P460 family protein n=1 Tax=Bradyrhizobium sp. STM 3843 TaxID=551947 RepID=UPI00024030F1|nr:cytochrome P460 family protein [Bradyrhizobium sp. STM 3843]CCE10663.1 Cytochrome P460 [Bradyrhizobium sp. STM 3843]
MKAIGAAGLAVMVLLGIAAAAKRSSIWAAESSAATAGKTAADSEGHLRVPDDYRTSYQVLGSWAIAADDGKGSKELHVVYASPGTIDAYRRDKRFPDGAVLIKEVFSTATGEMTTGTVSRAGALKGWFVMVKDRANRHPGNPLWGDGWGWSWFDATDPSRTTSTDYKVDCQSCHVPAQASDWVYVDGYPPLKR